MVQGLSLLGAALVFGAYLGLQADKMSPESRAYNLLNLVGSLILAGVAIADGRLGFILLNAAWVAVTIPRLFGRRSDDVVSRTGGGFTPWSLRGGNSWPVKVRVYSSSSRSHDSRVLPKP